jgi:hypothetical protein
MGCIIKGDSRIASGGKTFSVVGSKASLASNPIKQTA